MTHRGRIQAQGGGLEESVSWSQPTSPTMEDGLKMIEHLQSKLSHRELLIRKKEFEKAKMFIRQAAEKGGVDAQVRKSFRVKNTRDKRIDLEVIEGRAFIPDLANKDEISHRE